MMMMEVKILTGHIRRLPPSLELKNEPPKKKRENARRVNFGKPEFPTEKSVFSREFSMEDFEGKPGGALS